MTRCLNVWNNVKVYTELRNLKEMEELSHCRPWECSRCRLWIVSLAATQLVLLESSNWKKKLLLMRQILTLLFWMIFHSFTLGFFQCTRITVFLHLKLSFSSCLSDSGILFYQSMFNSNSVLLDPSSLGLFLRLCVVSVWWVCGECVMSVWWVIFSRWKDWRRCFVVIFTVSFVWFSVLILWRW
jgi:hypothetical protein